MTDAARETPAAVFAIPEHALLELVQLLHHLKLQTWLMDTGTSASRPDAHLRPDAMAWWFATLHRDIERIVDATYYSATLAAEFAQASERA